MARFNGVFNLTYYLSIDTINIINERRRGTYGSYIYLVDSIYGHINITFNRRINYGNRQVKPSVIDLTGVFYLIVYKNNKGDNYGIMEFVNQWLEKMPLK